VILVIADKSQEDEAIPLAIGVDLGGTKIRGAVVEATGQVLAEVRYPTGPGGAENVIARVKDVVRSLLSDPVLAKRKPLGIGVGAPGYVDPRNGTMRNAANLEVDYLSLGPILEAEFALPVAFANDANAAVLGEKHFGAGRGVQYLAYLSLGTGIGLGLILDGKLYLGARGLAGEIGNMQIGLPHDADRSEMGGNLESLAAGPAVARKAQLAIGQGEKSLISQMADRGDITAETVARAARQGDALGMSLLREAASYLGLAIAGLIDLLDLELVIVGGGLSESGEFFLEAIREVVRRHVLPVYRDVVPIVRAALGEHAGVIGAASLIFVEGNFGRGKS